MKRGGNSEPSWKAVACVLREKGEDKEKEGKNGGDDEWRREKRKDEEKVQERMRHEEKEWVEEKTRRHELVRGKEQELVWGRGGGG
jgi:hypothetical protein